MNKIPIAVIRKARFTEYQLHLLRRHGWFLAEHKGTMSFRPTQYQSDRITKQVLDSYLSGVRSLLLCETIG